MSDRRYTEEEVARIFERATKARPGTRQQIASGTGLTLSELQEIGQEVGIQPEAVREAALALEQPEQRTARYFLGFPIGVAKTVELNRPLSEAEWERLVVDLRETFDARGRVAEHGTFRQWTNGNLQALLEPTATGQRLRLRTTKGSSRSLMSAGLGVMGIAAVTLVSGLIAGGAVEPELIRSLGLLSVMGVGLFSAGAFRLPGWAQLRKQQMEAIAARVARLTSSTQELPPGTTW